MQLIHEYAWLVPILPCLGAGIIGLGLLSFRKATRTLRSPSALISIGTLGIAMMLSFGIFWEEVVQHSTHMQLWSWIQTTTCSINIGYIVDPLSSIMLVLVTTVGVAVMIYNDGYMSHDQGYVRFFAYLRLFTASML